MKKTKNNILDNIEETLLVIMMGAIAFVIFIQVVFRVLGKSLPWSEELSRYMLVGITFIGASYGIRRKAHVGVEAVLLALPEKYRDIVSVINVIICIIFNVVVCAFSIKIIHTQILYGQVSPAMQIPMWIAYLPIPIGMSFMVIRYIQSIIDGSYKVRNPGDVDIDQKEVK